jgi:D-serine deaminase-like pyridoxal phosphate-dependent protein
MALPTFPEMRPELGQPVEDLDTPIVVGDLDVLERNLETYRKIAEENDVSVRSHTKAHKIPSIARLQEETLGGGVLCQKLSEAEVMARNGIEDILLVCPVVSEAKLNRLFWVDAHTKHFATMIDCPGNITPLQDAVETARFIAEQPNLHLMGLLGHDAHVTLASETEAEYEAGCREVATDMERTVDMLDDAGIEVDVVTSGCSATARFIAPHDTVTELDPGRYVFNDASLLESRVDIDLADCGMTVLTTVISRPTADRAIVDAGSKTISYSGSPNPVPKNRNDISFEGKSSEHGSIDVSEAETNVEVGDRLELSSRTSTVPSTFRTRYRASGTVV